MAYNILKFVKPYVVRDGKGFRLKDFDTEGRRHGKSGHDAKSLLEYGVNRLRELQEKLYADDRWGVLLIFQAMDAAGKDGAIKHVMSGVNPQGCEVYSFKSPSAMDLDHDFLWRTSKVIPERGRIGIFNRSYYEETVAVRVNPAFLKGQKIPSELVTKRIWKERFQDINAFERHLARNGYVIRKFYLNLSKKEQKRRFLERLDVPEKNWKFSSSDLEVRGQWDEYMEAYEDTIRHTSTKYAPWVVVPADDKKVARIVVAAAVIDALEELDLAFPKVDGRQRAQLDEARHVLESKGKGKGDKKREA